VTSPVPEQLQAALGAGYTLERELGRGGMATVYLARDAKHGREVALKVLHEDLATSLGPERFRREIGFAATLQHPHILTVLDSGETRAGHLWFTMPYVEGESLRDRLRRQAQLSLEDAIRITHEVALALDFAHKRGIVHRDVKPENILLTSDGQALLADFGIARALAVPGSGATLTATGMIVGTAAYMSPEQASGERTVGPPSDIYSLGAVCYEMLAGEPPFTGATAQAVIAKMMSSEAPSVRRARASVPEGIDAALRRALAPVPADRWATAGEFAKALDVAERTAARTASPRVTPTTGTHPAKPSKSRVPVAALTLGLGFLIGVGVLFAWRAKGGVAAASSGATRLAVLPFENLGDSADAYFADGVTDAVRGKLTGLSGLEVIGSASSGQYRHTTKTPQQIAQELGVRYLLVGKVRWAKGPGGTSRVQVSPELLDASTAADKWAQPFDAPLTDVFQVQGDIAGKVATALQVALTPAAEHTLESRPTSDLAAYDAYLRGVGLTTSGNAPAIIRRAIAAFREAVGRDTTFALAWARLGVNYALLYANTNSTPEVADSADRATARALALAPDLGEAHAARAAFYGLVKSDNVRSTAEAEAGLARSPNNSVLLRSAAGSEEAGGRWAEALAHAQQGVRIDPRDAGNIGVACEIERWERRYADATPYCAREVALRPENLAALMANAMLALGQGDLAGARRVIHSVPPTIDQSALVAYFGQYWDLGWALDSAQQARLVTLRPDAFDGDRATWGIVLAQVYALRGDRAHTQAYADSARAESETQLVTNPGDDQRHLFHGLSLAYLGRSADAVREAERGAALMPLSKSARVGAYDQNLLARVYLVAEQPEKALDVLEALLKVPFYISPAWLRIDPTWAALHGNPRFERMIAGG
jgi:eukaryotic-like serine/threonine-protein kinase